MAKNDSDILTWMKLDKDFPSKYKIRALINQKASGRGLNGYEMFTIFFLMLCESIPHGGELRYSKDKPYDAKLLADVLCLSKNDVETACKVLQELEILERKSDGTLRFSCVEQNICSTTKGAERIRKLRKRELTSGTNEPVCTRNEPETNPICTQEYKSIRDIRNKENKNKEELSYITPPTPKRGNEEEEDSEGSGDAGQADDPNLPERSFMVLCARQRGIGIPFLDRFVNALKAADYQYPDNSGKLQKVNRGNFTIFLQAAWNDASVARKEASKTAGFVPPSQEEVEAHFKAERFKSDPQEFWRYYQSIGWKRGRAQITDWKMVASSWEAQSDFRGSHGASGTTRKGTQNGTRNTRDPNHRNPELNCDSRGVAEKLASLGFS